MNKNNELIILCRNNNGRFKKQIKLGDNFITEVNKMSSSLTWLGSQNQKLQLDNKLLN